MFETIKNLISELFNFFVHKQDSKVIFRKDIANEMSEEQPKMMIRHRFLVDAYLNDEQRSEIDKLIKSYCDFNDGQDHMLLDTGEYLYDVLDDYEIANYFASIKKNNKEIENKVYKIIMNALR